MLLPTDNADQVLVLFFFFFFFLRYSEASKQSFYKWEIELDVYFRKYDIACINRSYGTQLGFCELNLI